jgi:ribosomal-protein-alanine N-acetyltransferase
MIGQLQHGCADDLDSVMRVMTAAFPERYGEAWTRSQCAGILPMTGVKLVLATDSDDRVVVGFALYRTVADDAELLLLAVDPQSQGRGIGRQLLAHFIRDSRSTGAKRIHLEVRDGNSAVRIYQAAGFEQANRRRNYYRSRDGNAFDALTFVLSEES